MSPLEFYLSGIAVSFVLMMLWQAFVVQEEDMKDALVISTFVAILWLLVVLIFIGIAVASIFHLIVGGDNE